MCANFQRSNVWSVATSTTYPNHVFWTSGTSVYRQDLVTGAFETWLRIGSVTDFNQVQWTWANIIINSQLNAAFLIRPDTIASGTTLQILRYAWPPSPRPFTLTSGSNNVSNPISVSGASNNKVGWISFAPVGANTNGTVRSPELVLLSFFSNLLILADCGHANSRKRGDPSLSIHCSQLGDHWTVHTPVV
jgi:hypothetical protein